MRGYGKTSPIQNQLFKNQELYTDPNMKQCYVTVKLHAMLQAGDFALDYEENKYIYTGLKDVLMRTLSVHK